MTNSELKRFILACNRAAKDDSYPADERQEALKLAREGLRRFRDRT